MTGPLDEERILGMLSRGEVSENDLAQRDGLDVWVPLRRLIPPKTEPTRLDRALEFAREWSVRFWNALHLDPLRAGLASLLAGCLLIIFPSWTFMLFVPALAAAVFAGAILMTRRHFASGAMLSASALVFPALFLLAGRDAKSARLFAALPAPLIESVVPAKKPSAFPAKPTPCISHSGLALPRPVLPTPTPRAVPPI